MDPTLVEILNPPLINEPVILRAGTQSAITIYRGGFYQLVGKRSAYGLTPKNAEQRIAMEFLLDKNVPVLSLLGRAGSGKTLIALAAALEMVEKQKAYQKILIARPLVSLEDHDELGFLKGTLEEKLSVWCGPIWDNLFVLGINKAKLAQFIEAGMVDFTTLQHIRGRSLNNAYIIVDEAQNLSKHAIKTVATRIGMNSKLVFTGDQDQIDKQELRDENNGLYHLIERTKDQPLVAYVRLRKSERSAICELLSQLL